MKIAIVAIVALTSMCGSALSKTTECSALKAVFVSDLKSVKTTTDPRWTQLHRDYRCSLLPQCGTNVGRSALTEGKATEEQFKLFVNVGAKCS